MGKDPTFAHDILFETQGRTNESHDAFTKLHSKKYKRKQRRPATHCV